MQKSSWLLQYLRNTLGTTALGSGIGAGVGALSGDAKAGAQMGGALGLGSGLGLNKLFKPQHYAGSALGGGLGGMMSDDSKGGMLLGSLAGLGGSRLAPYAYKGLTSAPVSNFMNYDLLKMFKSAPKWNRSTKHVNMQVM